MNTAERRQALKNLLLFIAFVGAVLLLGCGEEDTEPSPLKSESIQDNLLGEMKRLGVSNTPAAPQMPGIGSLTVTEVGYYRDLRLSKPITGTVEPGTTVYTKVVFSKPMRLVVSDEGNARPILSFVIDGRAVRYRMKQRETSGKNLQSGDSKPRNKKNDQFLCKYTVQADDKGPFTLKVGKFSTDTDGNKLAKTYVHGTVLQLGQQMPPEVTEVSYYRDLRFNKPITGMVEPGTTVYTKVVFSEPMRHIASDEKDARPILSFVIDGRAVRYRMKQRETSGKNLQSGDSKPRNKKNDQFLCKYTVQADDEGPFTLKVGKFSTDTDGNKLAKTYVHGTVLQLGQQMPPEVTEVSYYRDLRFNKPITGMVEPGTTVYTKVVFSEPMRHIASDEKDARPILSFVIDGRAVRYRMKQRETSGKNLQSGDSKPRNKKNDQFLCKYTVQADDEGPFTLKVGKFSTDTDGNKLAKTYEHNIALLLEQGIQERLEIKKSETPEGPEIIKEPGKSSAAKAPIILEVEMAKAAGLVGNSPLVRAIRIADRINERWRKEDIIHSPDFLQKADTIFREETNNLGGMNFFFDFLPQEYFLTTVGTIPGAVGADEAGIPRGGFSRYWLVVEYLRLTFENPDANKLTILELFKQSAKQGRLSVETPEWYGNE